MKEIYLSDYVFNGDSVQALHWVWPPADMDVLKDYTTGLQQLNPKDKSIFYGEWLIIYPNGTYKLVDNSTFIAGLPPTPPLPPG
jgi:hypothetical protein